MLQISHERIVGCSYRPSPNVGRHFKPGLPDMIILHYTGSQHMDGAISWFQRKSSKVSAHLVIGRNGEIVQMVDFDRVAWHAGRSSFRFPEESTRVGINQYALGIEMVNAGLLHSISGGGWANGDNERVNAAEVVECEGKCWHNYPRLQVERAIEVCRALCSAKGITPDMILGHSHVSPGRKIDPGPHFSLKEVRLACFSL